MYTWETRVRYSECGRSKQTGPAVLFDYMQDACTFQAEELGVGPAFMKARQCAWILKSWQADIARYPGFGETIRIATWPYDFHGFYGYRNFEITDQTGTVLVRANSIWVFIDLQKGRPVKIIPEVASAYTLKERLEMEYTDRRVADFESGEDAIAVLVPEHFIDTNEHMNNTKYILLSEELLPSDFNAARIRVEYRKAAGCGDTVYPCILRQKDMISIAINDRHKKPFAIAEFYRNPSIKERSRI